MVKPNALCWVCLAILLLGLHGRSLAQQEGSIRGTVTDKDFESPVSNARVVIVEIDTSATTTEEGNYVISEVPAGTYTLVFSKPGYIRQVKTDVVVSAGQMTDVNVSVSGEFEEMEEFIVQDIKIGGTEAALLELRIKSPALMDSVSSELMSQAGAGDAASALKLVSGATVQDGKYATVRGLPDRYVNSQLNAVRLPTADIDKRAVELDQFPSDVIESIQVSKTFTPDQQGDASGGAVNVILKGIPDDSILKFSVGRSFNTQVTGNNDFLSYEGGGVGCWGIDDGRREAQPVPGNWDGAVGASRNDAPTMGSWSLAMGGKHEFTSDIKVGGFASFYYDKDASYHDDGFDDDYWVYDNGRPMTPVTSVPLDPNNPTNAPEDYTTSLFDIVEGSRTVQWGGLGTLGLEVGDHDLKLIYMYTRSTEDKAILAEDTRGKHYFFPDFTPEDPGDSDWFGFAPYLRTHTLEYTERTTQTLQLSGRHVLPMPETGIEEILVLLPPQIDWTIAGSSAGMYQPDKRLFGTKWIPAHPGFPNLAPASFRPYKPAINAKMGNLQRLYKDIREESDQYFYNVKFPFRQWTKNEGYLKLGVFHDEVHREYDQESYSNYDDGAAKYLGDWSDFWTPAFPNEDHPIKNDVRLDVDYTGDQTITAWYYMLDVPIFNFFKVIGGARYETTELSIINDPEEDALWYPEDESAAVDLDPGEGNVFYQQEDILPSIAFVLTPIEEIMVRFSYSETVARQTFKELTPILQTEFLGGDVFVGNPNLKMAALENYDLRFDYRPYEGGLISVSWFHKDVYNPIEYVQRIKSRDRFTTAVNFPEGYLTGYEIEVRQNLGFFWEELQGLSIGANATFIDSEVTLSQTEANMFSVSGYPMPTRDMMQAPEHLYNIYFTYDSERWGTKIGLFYTVKGDTLVKGPGLNDSQFLPSIYEKEYGTLNFTISQKLNENWTIGFKAKNLLNPAIQEVYRSDYIGDDVVKSSYKKGIDFSLSLSATF